MRKVSSVISRLHIPPTVGALRTRPYNGWMRRIAIPLPLARRMRYNVRFVFKLLATMLVENTAHAPSVYLWLWLLGLSLNVLLVLGVSVR